MMVSAQSLADIPPERLTVLLARALAYDAKLKERAGASVDVAVLYRPTDATGQATAQRIAAAFNSLSDLRLMGLALHAVAVAYTGSEALTASIKASSFDEVFLVGAFEGERERVRKVCDPLHVLTLAAARADAEAGIALAVDDHDGKPSIFVNVESSKAAGAQLASGLLRLAILIKGAQ